MVDPTLDLNLSHTDQTTPVIHEVCIHMMLQQQDAPFHLLLETELG
jgi:hypothetical protein